MTSQFSAAHVNVSFFPFANVNTSAFLVVGSSLFEESQSMHRAIVRSYSINSKLVTMNAIVS